MKHIVFYPSLLVLLCACAPTDDSTMGKDTKPRQPVSEAPNAKAAMAAGDVVMRETTERLFQNPYDTEAVYFISQRSGTPDALTVLIKRDSQGGTQYSRWLFNCGQQTAQNFGVASNIQALDKSVNSQPSKAQHYELKSRLGAIATSVCK